MNTRYAFEASGPALGRGGPVQYGFEWESGDGRINTQWLPGGKKSTSFIFREAGTYKVMVHARYAGDWTVESEAAVAIVRIHPKPTRDRACVFRVAPDGTAVVRGVVWSADCSVAAACYEIKC